MYKTFTVCISNTRQNLLDYIKGFNNFQPFFSENNLFESFTFNIFHGYPQNPVIISKPKHRYNIRMI